MAISQADDVLPFDHHHHHHHHLHTITSTITAIITTFITPSSPPSPSPLPTLILHHSSRTTHHTPLNHTPLISHHSSHTTHHTPLILHHSSYTTHHTPLITHHSSYTTHLTPITTQHSSHTTIITFIATTITTISTFIATIITTIFSLWDPMRPDLWAFSFSHPLDLKPSNKLFLGFRCKFSFFVCVFSMFFFNVSCFCASCSRMRSEGFSFNSGGLGVESCSRSVVSMFATVRNRSQPSATVRNRSQPSATVRSRTLRRCHWGKLLQVTFHGCVTCQFATLFHCDLHENDMSRKKRDAFRCTGAVV